MRPFWIPLSTCALIWTTNARSDVPLRRDSTGHMVVPTMVNGTGPVDFTFDTGADETAVFSWLAKQLHLPAAGKGQVSGATGSAEMSLSRIATLSVDGHELANLSAVTLPDRADGPQLGGVVGVDMMAGRLTVIDFGCGTAALRPLKSIKSVIGDHAHMVEAGSIPGGKQLTLPVTINGVPGVAVLDTGDRATIINGEFAKAAGLDPQSPAFRDGDPARGVTRQAVKSRVGPIGTVEFAGIVLKSATARVSDLPAFDSAGLRHTAVMVLGLDLLQGTRISVDYSARRFWVAPSTCH